MGCHENQKGGLRHGHFRGCGRGSPKTGCHNLAGKGNKMRFRVIVYHVWISCICLWVFLVASVYGRKLDGIPDEENRLLKIVTVSLFRHEDALVSLFLTYHMVSNNIMITLFRVELDRKSPDISNSIRASLFASGSTDSAKHWCFLSNTLEELSPS